MELKTLEEQGIPLLSEFINRSVRELKKNYVEPS